MRRFFLLLLCCVFLGTSVSAASGVTSAQSQTTVSANGSCQVTLTLLLTLEEPVADLRFPLPENAKDITLNGSTASSSRGDGVRYVELEELVCLPGSYTLTIRYRLSDAVSKTKAGDLALVLELLSGFAYPIEKLSFSVTLPGEVPGTPAFVSTYYQEGVDTLMETAVQGNQITGSFLQPLKDNETLTMTLPVSEEMFPQSVAKKWSMDTVDLLMLITAGLALLYWCLTMRCLPPRRIRRATQPEGVTAGELGCHLTGLGVDFNMMVLSWAQMGYLLVQLDENGRVLLHKRMDMGNERSDFENRYFRKLFGRRKLVDGTGYHYARLCKKAGSHRPGIRMDFQANSGNPMVFRFLSMLVGLLSGVSLATAFVTDTVWQVLLSVILGLAGAVTVMQIHAAAQCVHTRRKQQLLGGVICGAVWLILSFLAQEWSVAVFVIPAAFISGFAAAYGGRRSENGKQMASEILGLGRYMRTVEQEELRAIMRSNPDYFYQLAPCAMALGVEKAFARQFRKAKLPECAYLVTDIGGTMTASEWIHQLREVVKILDAHQKPFSLDKLLGK